jgi:hypothetical protein
MEVKPRGGYKNVSRWQKVAIESVLMYGGRQAAADHLDMPKKSLDDLLYRAYRALDVKNFDEAINKLGIKEKLGFKVKGDGDELSGNNA